METPHISSVYVLCNGKVFFFLMALIYSKSALSVFLSIYYFPEK